jgi:hypothetical protein
VVPVLQMSGVIRFLSCRQAMLDDPYPAHGVVPVLQMSGVIRFLSCRQAMLDDPYPAHEQCEAVPVLQMSNS